MKRNSQTLSHDLLQWFYENKRQMPWRETNDPYKIWLSEVMLQQTQVTTVINYYNRFIERFPTIESLAKTPIDQVRKYWEGLGYYSRIKNFHEAVQTVQKDFNGQVPNDPKQFLNLKGVGPYTQGAVMSIAFNHPLPAVDGNVYRVYSRLDNDAFDIASAKARLHFEEKVLEDMPEAAGDFNEALMELGAVICTPKKPLCMLCPVQQHCESFEVGNVLERPVKLKKIKKRVEHYDVYLIENDGELLIERRPDGLLASMFQFPMFEAETHISNVESQLDMSLTLFNEPLMTLKHQFTHLTWHLTVYIAHTNDKKKASQHWMSREEKSQLTFPTSMNKIYEHYLSSL